MDGNKICCGIVTYNPNPILFKEVIEAVSKQVGKIYIWDNGSENVTFIENICQEFNVQLLSSGKNEGIAYGLNRICENALVDGYKWILTLDHDTIVADDYVEKIDLNIKTTIGIICPSVKYVGLDTGQRCNDSQFEEVQACMTSGSIMSLIAWKKVGKFDEWLFIDSVDNDICYKMRKNNYLIVRDAYLKIVHNLGNPNKKRFIFYKYIDYQYPPFRIYYIVRNRIYITSKYWRLNGIKFVGASLKIIVNAFLSSIHSKEKLKSFQKGIKDGVYRILSFPKI